MQFMFDRFTCRVVPNSLGQQFALDVG